MLCGNGTIDQGEACDGNELGGETCITQGFSGGDLACGQDCQFDTSGCYLSTCGNGTIEPGETCDGNDLGGQTCQGLGFSGGTLACNPDCMSYDTSNCTAAECSEGEMVACYEGPIGTEGLGVCQGGIKACSGGTFGPCQGQVTPQPEICGNGLDDNCDGVVDDGCDYCVGKPDTTPCDDGNACTTGDACQGEVCVGGTPIVCTQIDECHQAGTCNPLSGTCTNPTMPDGTACSTGTCQAGVCTTA